MKRISYQLIYEGSIDLIEKEPFCVSVSLDRGKLFLLSQNILVK